MKIYTLLIISLFSLLSCFSGDDSSSVTGLVLQENEDFSILIPSTWINISEADLVTPKSGEVALALRSPTQKQGYINNIVVLKVDNTSISASEIIDSGIQSLEKGIRGYQLISSKESIFADNQTGKIITYTGKYSNDTPETIYIQSARVCDNNGYYMTISLTEKIDSYDRYEYILQNFKCK